MKIGRGLASQFLSFLPASNLPAMERLAHYDTRSSSLRAAAFPESTS
jgi:hypothetical protein